MSTYNVNLTGWERLARDWSTLSQDERETYTCKLLRNSIDLRGMLATLNNACGAGHVLTLPELQSVRFVIERLAVLDIVPD